MTASRNEREVISEVIEIYRLNPCLWDTGDKNYKDISLKKSAWQSLLNKYKEFDKECNEATIKKKIDHLKTSYFRESKKVKASKNRTGSAASDVHIPNLWYYELMTFLEQKNEANRAGVDTLMSDDEDIPETSGLKRRVTKQKHQNFQLKKEKLIDTATEWLKTDDLHKDTPNPFGVYIGKKVEEIADTTQRDIAEKLICKIIFLAKTNNLTIDTKIEGTRNQVSSYPSNTQYQIHNNPANLHSTILPHQKSVSTISSDIQPHTPFSQTQRSLQISSHHNQIFDSATSPDILPHTPFPHKQRRLQVSSQHNEMSESATLHTQYQINNNPSSPTYVVIQPHQISDSATTGIQSHTPFSHTQRRLQFSSPHHQISDPAISTDIQPHTSSSPTQPVSAFHTYPESSNNVEHAVLYGEGSNGELLKEMLVFKKKKIFRAIILHL